MQMQTQKMEAMLWSCDDATVSVNPPPEITHLVLIFLCCVIKAIFDHKVHRCTSVEVFVEAVEVGHQIGVLCTQAVQKMRYVQYVERDGWCACVQYVEGGG